MVSIKQHIIMISEESCDNEE